MKRLLCALLLVFCWFGLVGSSHAVQPPSRPIVEPPIIYYLGVLRPGFPEPLIVRELGYSRASILYLKQGLILFGINEQTRFNTLLKNLTFLKKVYADRQDVLLDWSLPPQGVVKRFLSVAGRQSFHALENRLRRNPGPGLSPKSAEATIQRIQAADGIIRARAESINSRFSALASAGTGSISGRVTDLSNNGLSLLVVAYDLEFNHVAEAVSDSTGNYRLEGLAPGDYRVYFWPYGINRIPEWYNNQVTFDAADPVSVADGQTTSGIDAQLEEGGILTGRVTDTSGVGIPDTLVEVFDQNGFGIYACFTGGDGAYQALGLPTGYYTLHFFPNIGNYVPERYDNRTPFEAGDEVSVTAGQTTLNIDAVLESGGSISGYVTDGSGNGIQDVTIQIYRLDYSRLYWTEATTDGFGNYTIEKLPVGQFKVYFDTTNVGGFSAEWFDNKDNFYNADGVDVSSGQTTPGIDAQLSQGGAIAGQVTDGSGRGVPDVYCDAYDLNWSWVSSGVTDSAGQYLISGLPSGGYKVYFYPSSGNLIEEWYDNKSGFESADTVTVEAPQTTFGVNAQLASGGSISGRVTNKSGQGIPEVNIDVYSPSGWAGFGYTDSDGRYLAERIPAGSYRVYFGGQPSTNYVSEWFDNKKSYDRADPVQVAAGQTTSGIDAVLSAGGSVTGRVTDENGEPLSDLQVTAEDLHRQSRYYTWPDGNGEYRIQGIPSGNYKVEFLAYGTYVTQWFNQKPSFEEADYVHVTAGKTTAGVDARLVQGGSIAGRLTDISGNGLCSVNVIAYDLEHRIQSDTYSDCDGNYTIQGIPTGQFMVYFTDEYGENISSYIPEWYDNQTSFEAADSVSVTAGETTSGIDAQLSPRGPVTVLKPEANAIWIKGRLAQIQWSASDAISAVNISLYNSAGWVKNIALQTANDGQEDWTVPEDLGVGSDYRVRVEDAADANVHDYSASFSIRANLALYAPLLRAPLYGSSDQPISIRLQWQDTNSNPQESGYRIRIKPEGGDYRYFHTAQDATSYTLDLAPYTTYYWNVKASGKDGAKDSPWANFGNDWKFTTASE